MKKGESAMIKRVIGFILVVCASGLYASDALKCSEYLAKDYLQFIDNNAKYSTKPDRYYKNFINDIETIHKYVDSNLLIEKSKTFFKKNGLLLNWREFEKLDQLQRINTLAMIAPITNEEKQKLLESISLDNKVKTLESIISFYLHETGTNNQTMQ